MKCAFCSTVWKTRKAKGTRSAFSWTATFATIIALAAVSFFVGREFGLLSKTPNFIDEVQPRENGLEPLTESAEYVESAELTGDESGSDGEIVETSEQTEAFESGETSETSEDAAAE